MIEESRLKEVFSAILSGEGIMAPIEKIKIKGIMDEPGLHWSNPGVKQASVYAGGKSHQFVVKKLGKHSKREIHVYRFLSVHRGFPIPRLYHDVYDDDTNEYWMVIEKCVSRQFTNIEDFYQQCGLLLARIHAPFWDKTDILPDFFQSRIEMGRLSKATDRLSVFLESLSRQDVVTLEEGLGTSIDDLHSAVSRLNKGLLRESPETTRCLIHGSFHPPEIMWRKAAGEYTPVGVDWEGSRVGMPAEDLAFSGENLLAKGEDALLNDLLDTYLSELKEHGINLNRNEISTSTRHEVHVKMMSRQIPFVLQTYLRVHNDDSYAGWCQWFRQNQPDTMRFVQSEIESGDIYGE